MPFFVAQNCHVQENCAEDGLVSTTEVCTTFGS